MYAVYLLLCLLMIPALARAEAFVCEVAATPGKFSRFLPSTDPSRFVAGATETCNQVPEAQTPSQIDLYNTVPSHYLKTTGTPPALLLAEMSQGEKQQVDQALNAQKAKHEAWAAQAQTPGQCKFQLPSEIHSKTGQMKGANATDINALTLSQPDKDLLIAITDRLSNAIGQAGMCDASRASGG